MPPELVGSQPDSVRLRRVGLSRAYARGHAGRPSAPFHPETDHGPSDDYVAILGYVDARQSGASGQRGPQSGCSPATPIMTSNNTPADEGGHEETQAQHAEEPADAESPVLKRVARHAQRVQNAVQPLESEVAPENLRDLQHLEHGAATIEDWADNASPGDIDALVGAKTIVEAEQERVQALRDEVGAGRTSVVKKFDTLADRLKDLREEVDPLTFDVTAYVVYVNKRFVKRYDESSVEVETILVDADKKNPEELGLFPTDGLEGEREEDLAFPAGKQLDLRDEYRTFFQSTSDGGKIAHE